MEIETLCKGCLAELRGEAFGQTIHVAGGESGAAVVSAWSSAHHALALRHLDPEAARVELSSLYAACQDPDGRLAQERPVGPDDLARRIERLGPAFRDDGRMAFLGPPISAYAAARVALQVGRRARGLLERATAQLDAIWGERLPPETALPVILHPYEAGTLGSPVFDPLLDPDSYTEWREDAASLARSAIACDLSPERALRAGHLFVVEDPVFCGWLLLALEETALAWEELGDGDAVRKLRIRSEMIAEGVRQRLWSEELELFCGYDRARDRPLPGVGVGGLVPAASRSLIMEGCAKRAIERYLRPSSSPLWNRIGISSTPIEVEPMPAEDPVPWRGNLVAPAAQYWAHLALVRAQRVADARVLSDQLEQLVRQAGFGEFYDVLTGELAPVAPPGAHTSDAVLLLEMRAQETQGRS